jgi:hypothetical protein
MISNAKILSNIQQPDTEALTPKQLLITQQQWMFFTHESQYGSYHAVS